MSPRDGLDRYEAAREAVFSDTDPDDEDGEFAECGHQFWSLTDEGVCCRDCGMTQARINAHVASMKQIELWRSGK